MKMAAFLGKSPTQEQLAKLQDHLRFESMSKNESVNREFFKTIGVARKDGAFIRKGSTYFLNI